MPSPSSALSTLAAQLRICLQGDPAIAARKVWSLLREAYDRENGTGSQPTEPATYSMMVQIALRNLQPSQRAEIGRHLLPMVRGLGPLACEAALGGLPMKEIQEAMQERPDDFELKLAAARVAVDRGSVPFLRGVLDAWNDPTLRGQVVVDEVSAAVVSGKIRAAFLLQAGFEPEELLAAMADFARGPFRAKASAWVQELLRHVVLDSTDQLEHLIPIVRSMGIELPLEVVAEQTKPSIDDGPAFRAP